MRIGELAERSGIAAHTIRFYETKGLLPAADRSSNGYRRYNEQTLERLMLIQLCQRLGFNLTEIEQLMAHDGSWDKEVILENLDARLLEIQQLQQGLESQRIEILNIKSQLQQRWQSGDCLSGVELQCLSQHMQEEPSDELLPTPQARSI